MPLLRLNLLFVCSQEAVRPRPYHLRGALKEHVIARIRLAPIETHVFVGVVGSHERRCLVFAHVQGVFQVRNSDALHNQAGLELFRQSCRPACRDLESLARHASIAPRLVL